MNAERPGWWFTWLSSRDRFNSSLYDWWCEAVGAVARLDAAREPQIRLTTAQPALAHIIRRAAAKRGWRIESRLTDDVVWAVGAVRVRTLGYWRAIKEMAAALQMWIEARRQPTSRFEPKSIRLIIIVPATAEPLISEERPYRDTYFGDLAQQAAGAGWPALVVGFPVTSRRATVAALAKRRDVPAASVAHYFTLFDVAAAAWRAVTASFSCAPLRLPAGDDVSDLAAADLAAARGDIFFGTLLERAMARLLRMFPDAQLVHTYENNPWERAVDRAAKSARPARYVTGYLHCAVLPSHLKNVITAAESRIRPAPDRIVCTGPAARDILLGLGAHDPAQVVPGCALRGPRTDLLPARAGPPRRIRSILAVLEGLPSMVHLLRFLDRAAPHLSGRRIYIRAHPVMPLSVLLPRAGITLVEDGVLAASQAASLAEAFEQADAVIYQSSTAALTALGMGIPVIKVKLPGPLEDDPLFKSFALKRTVRSPGELAQALAAIETLSPNEFTREAAAARAYLRQYLTPPPADFVTSFIPPAQGRS